MKKALVSVSFALLVIIPYAEAQRNVKAHVLHASFYAPGKGPYVETYVTVIGGSVVMTRNAAKKYQGAVEISMAFSQKGEIKSAKKYTLISQEVEDTSGVIPNFIDQQRTSLPNGDYDLEISIQDKNNITNKPVKGSMAITVDFPENKVSVSDIELLESYTKVYNQGPLTKSGYDLVPYPYQYYPETVNKLGFYAEIYNTKQVLGIDERFVAEYYVESFESKARISSMNSFSRQTTGSVNVVLAEFLIQDLPTGNYNMVMEIKDKTGAAVAVKKAFFQRKNPKIQMSLEDISAMATASTFVTKMNNVDSLAEFVRSLRPISSQMQIHYAETQLNNKDLGMMQKYFLNFWMTRNAENPEQAWFEYHKQVRAVQKEFGTKTLRGYDTDRGRVYLQYGPPDARTQVDNEPSAYPYEIWQYYKLKGQTNRKFVFCNPDLVTNNFRLIHSDALGEVNDPRWNMKVHNRDTQSQNFEEFNAPNHFGGNALDNFNNPR